MKTILSLMAFCLVCSTASAQLNTATLERAMANPDRPAAEKERDASRRAPQVLGFAGLESGMTVLDIIAAGGWYTEVLSYAVGDSGRVIMQNGENAADRYGDAIAELPELEVHPTGDTYGEDETNRAAEIWQERARTEWASVPAFTQLAEQLQVSGAPSQLVARAYKSAQDEYQHAVLAAGMSARLTGHEIELGHPETAHRLPVGGEEGLVRLAVESWVDGCLGEGTAARTARVESSQSDAPILQRTLLEIASDERAHAELAWDVMEWTLRAGGSAVARALDATRESSHSEPKTIIPAGLEYLGCGSTAQLSQLALEERQHCLERRDSMVKALG